MTTTASSSHVFVSYKREDREWASDVAQGLESAGFRVWIDSDLPGGEAWRDNIETALDTAGCVVVLWSQKSVGVQGGFVKSEADRGLKRGVLVPVLIEKDVRPPLGLDSIHAYDLSGWKSNPRDPDFLDFVSAVRAKITGTPAPPAMASRTRGRRRLMAGSATGLFVAFGWALAFNFFGAQDKLCTIPLGQPHLSDACGAWDLGNRPSRTERLAWEARPAGNCEALREHVKRFPNGAMRSKAADLLAAAIVTRSKVPTPFMREARGYVRQDVVGQANTEKAQVAARLLAGIDARELACRPASSHETLIDARLDSITFNCAKLPSGGITCGADYLTRCNFETYSLVESCG